MRRLILVLVLAAALAPASPAASTSTDADVGLSLDGTTFSRDLQGSLFPGGLRWVPGDVKEATFYVRNDGESSARMTIDVVGKRPNTLISTGELDITAQASSGVTTVVTDADEHQLLSDARIAKAEVVPVTVRVAFADEAQNGTQLLASDIDFRVTLTGTAGASSGDGSDSSDLLPDTGAPGLLALLLAAVLVAVGSAFIARRSTSTRDRNEGALHG